MLAKIEPGILNKKETDLLSFVVITYEDLMLVGWQRNQGPCSLSTLQQVLSSNEFQCHVMHVLKQLRDLTIANNFIDDCGIEGPESWYDDEAILGNPHFHRFVWEYIEHLDAFLGALIIARITASSMKAIFAALNLHIVVQAQDELKHCMATVPVLIKVDYKQAKLILPSPQTSDEGLLVVAIDSSWMEVGWALYQIRDSQKHISLYGSCMFNKTQQNYGQLKTEVFGTFMGLKDLHHHIWGVHFHLEHNAISLTKMLKEPDNIPNALML
ncbi:hypothetical protein F5146DRAFT_1007332 [Armillaria mellea]|nr:hypothetical protein F5146DRAFT_1007332 [Armillaria mellea]